MDQWNYSMDLIYLGFMDQWDYSMDLIYLGSMDQWDYSMDQIHLSRIHGAVGLTCQPYPLRIHIIHGAVGLTYGSELHIQYPWIS